MKFTLRIAGAAFVLALSPAVALAMPGQTVTQFTPWVKSNPALHGLARTIDEMTGSPFYQATFRAGGAAGTYTANVHDHEKISDEAVSLDAASESYDILKHLDTAALLVERVYGPAVSADLKAARKLGSWTQCHVRSATALYRGQLYGYELWWSSLKAIPLGRVDSAGKVAEFSDGLTAGGLPQGIALGADGNRWFTEYDGNKIGKLQLH